MSKTAGLGVIGVSAAILLAVGLAGISAGADAPASQAAPESQPFGGAVLAYVNGKPIMMARLHDLLVKAHGLELAQQLVADELVGQEAAKQGLDASDQEIDAESEATARRMFQGIDDKAQLMNLLEQIMAQRKISPEHWRMVMRRQVLLAKLARPKVKVTDDMLRDEFNEQYGRKVVVRHIQTATLGEAQEVLLELTTGADFAALAEKVSKNPSASEGGLLPPIGARSPGLPPAIRDAALAMKKVGEVSEPVQASAAFHILKVEKFIEPQNTRFQDVKDSLEKAVFQRELVRQQQQIMLDLIGKGQLEGGIRFVDPLIKEQADKAAGRQP